MNDSNNPENQPNSSDIPITKKKGKIYQLCAWLIKSKDEGNLLSKLFQRIMLGYSWAWGILIGVIFSISKSVIEGTNNFINIGWKEGFGVFHYSINWPAFIVWGLTLVLGLILYLQTKLREVEVDQLREEKRNQAEKKAKEIKSDYSEQISNAIAQLKAATNEVKSAVFNTPNPEIYTDYHKYFDEIYNYFQDLTSKIEDSKNDEEKLAHYHGCFKTILKTICGLTRRFTLKNEEYIYGANLMIYIHNDSTETIVKLFEKIKSNGTLIYLPQYEVKAFRGMVLGIEELIVTGDTARVINPVAIPIMKQADSKVTIPGACRAAAKESGDALVLNNVLDRDQYGEFTAHDGLAYFNGAGKDIKSLLSIQIPIEGKPESELSTQANITGILNVDCNKESLLGIDIKFSNSYFCLLRPIAYLFAPFLQDYTKIYLSKNA